jgi:hypothetical protein
MLANAVKHTTTTAGAGPLTVAIVTNFLPLSQRFALNQLFQYSAYTGTDAAPVFREAGIGALIASNVMARLSVRETSDGTTSNTITPTATDFGGASVTIICTPLPMFTESMAPTVDQVSSGVSRFVTSAGRNSAQVITGVTGLRLYYVPFLLRVGSPVTSLAMNVTTAGAAGTTARIGLYTCNEKGYPGALLATSGDIDTSTTGVKTATLGSALSLPPGWYFAAIVCSGAPTITCYLSGASNLIGCSPLGFNASLVAIEFRYETVASAVLPAAASATTTASAVGIAHPPLIFVGVA